MEEQNESMVELFIPIIGFPVYEIGNNGTVRTIILKCIRPSSTRLKQKYVQVNIFDADTKTITRGVASLVAKHFLPNPHNKTIVKHIDKNYLNNHVSNLVWR